jgi:hypothetical protein
MRMRRRWRTRQRRSRRERKRNEGEGEAKKRNTKKESWGAFAAVGKVSPHELIHLPALNLRQHTGDTCVQQA